MRGYENPEKTSENRLEPRSYYIPEGTAEYWLLNGIWRFRYFSRDIDVPETIEEWEETPVPSCWQMQGYENPNYTNINYPFPCDPPYVPDDNPCGVYERYGREMTLHANGLIKDNNGRICGSGKPVLYDMKQLVTKLGLPLQQVIRFASANPAAFLGISEETGDISINKLADIVVINEDFEVQATYIEGNKKYTLGDDVIGKEALKRKLR